MPGKLLQHVIEEADTGRHVECARAVEIDGGRDLGLLGLAGNGRLPLQISPLRLSLPRRNRAFISLSPAVPEPPLRQAGPAHPSTPAASRMQMQCKLLALTRTSRAPGTPPPYSPFVKMDAVSYTHLRA